MSSGYGTLYLCATPIGNLGDMTFRAVEILKKVSLIAAEDTRHTRKLTSHFDIHVPLTSYHEHNKNTKGPELVAKLLAGQDVALVSDAGLPGISDPGEDLARLAIEAGILVTPIPGACAALTALMASGLPTGGFLFVGFLPKATVARRNRLQLLRNYSETLLFYESPHQLLKTLNELQNVLGDRPAVIGRELTKIHEEFRRAHLSELTESFRQQPPRGEFVIIVAGKDGEVELPDNMKAPVSDESIRQEVARNIAAGENKKDAIRMTASKMGLSRRRVYQLALDSG
ncbi:MAG TPA: 16S rRNA (cytidine(1402)-2'-O)-methyltransferase [Negativicutes bacterium]|nr:16S rRNA (cytidine(1402)-2'-O)-methyltransferase [Negativicutes bacterium]